MVAMTTSSSCRVSEISAFCWPTSQTASMTNCLVAIVHTKPVIAILVPKLVAMATTFSTSGRPSNTWFFGPIRAHNPNGRLLDRFSRFCTGDRRVSYALQWDALFHKNVPSRVRSGHPSNTCFPGPTRVLNPNGISIGSAVFAWRTSVTDRPTDIQT